jgi:hypothetical protein
VHREPRERHRRSELFLSSTGAGFNLKYMGRQLSRKHLRDGGTAHDQRDGEKRPLSLHRSLSLTLERNEVLNCETLAYHLEDTKNKIKIIMPTWESLAPVPPNVVPTTVATMTGSPHLLSHETVIHTKASSATYR